LIDKKDNHGIRFVEQVHNVDLFILKDWVRALQDLKASHSEAQPLGSMVAKAVVKTRFVSEVTSLMCMWT
jgi:hypothetical protein